MTLEQDNGMDEGLADLLGDLDRLARRIDQRRCPGRAWSPPAKPRRVRRLLWPAAAVAAAWIIVASIGRRPAPPQADPVSREATPAVAALRMVKATDWSIPSDLGAPGGVALEFDVARMPAPSGVETLWSGRMTLSIPALSSW